MLIESLFFGFLGLLGLILFYSPALLGLCRFRTVTYCAFLLGIVAGGFYAAKHWEFPATASSDNFDDETIVPIVQHRGFVGSAKCQSCHQEQHASWHGTYHRTMTQLASPESVVAPFDGQELKHVSSFEETARVERVGDEFWVELDHPEVILVGLLQGTPVDSKDGVPKVRRQIVMTTGSHHFQVYWYRGPVGRELWQFPWRYNIIDEIWMHRDDVFLQPSDLPAGSSHQVWNKVCIECHSVNGQPGVDPSSGVAVDTKIAELGISCEACHGPGEQHVLAHQKNGRAIEDHETPSIANSNYGVVNPLKCDQEISSQICGSCHSVYEYTDEDVIATRYQTGRQQRAGSEFTELARFMDIRDEVSNFGRPDDIAISRFWKDGACRSGGREYNGMVESECYLQSDMTCVTCHSMHNSDPDDQLIPQLLGNDACYQCHSSFQDNLAEHTHHAEDSSGSQCYNCHMPRTSFALLKAIRSHRIDIPTVVSTKENSRPNACNLCHLDQTLEWSANHLAEWTGNPVPELAQDEKEVAALLVWLYRGDAGQRVIAASAMQSDDARRASGSDWLVPHLLQAQSDPYAAVRFAANKALRTIDRFSDVQFFYDQPADERAEYTEQLLEAWVEEQETDDESRTLLLSGGRPDQSKIDALREKRDNRRMVILE